MKTMKSKTFAFFDLDHTLLPVDSSGLWSYFLISKTGEDQQKNIQIEKQFDEDYVKGVLDIVKFEDFQMALLARFPRKELEQFRKEYIEKYIIPNIKPNAVELVEHHKKAGDTVVIVTATYRFVVEPIAKLFGADTLIAAEPDEDENGEFTGKWLWHTFKEGKIRAVNKFVEDKGGLSALKNSFFYSDSINDLPLLEYISEHGGSAIATNPDKALTVIAEKRGWEIMRLFPVREASMENISEKAT